MLLSYFTSSKKSVTQKVTVVVGCLPPPQHPLGIPAKAARDINDNKNLSTPRIFLSFNRKYLSLSITMSEQFKFISTLRMSLGLVSLFYDHFVPQFGDFVDRNQPMRIALRQFFFVPFSYEERIRRASLDYWLRRDTSVRSRVRKFDERVERQRQRRPRNKTYETISVDEVYTRGGPFSGKLFGCVCPILWLTHCEVGRLAFIGRNC